MLTPEEQKMLQELENDPEIGGAKGIVTPAVPTPKASSNLSPDEKAMLDELENDPDLNELPGVTIDSMGAMIGEVPSLVAGEAESLIRAPLKGASYGLTEPAISGTEAALMTAYKYLGNNPPKDIRAALKETYQEAVSRRNQQVQDFPITNMIGEGAGAVLGSMSKLTPVGAVGQGVAKAIGGKIAPKALQGGGALKDLIQGGINTAQTGLRAGIEAGIEQSVRKPVLESTGFARPDSMTGPIEMAEDTAKLTAGLITLGKALKGGVSTLFRIPKESIDWYLQNAKAVNESQSAESITQHVDEAIQKLNQDVIDHKLSVNETKNIINAYEQSVIDKLKQQQRDTSSWVDQAKNKFNNAKANIIRSIETSPVPRQMSSVAETISSKMKEKLGLLSEQSANILDASGTKLPTQYLKDLFRDEIVQLSSEIPMTSALMPMGKSRPQTVSKLQSYLDQLGHVGPELQGKQLKDWLLILQEDVGFSHAPGEYSDAFKGAMERIKGQLNNQIKQVDPNFKKFMEEVVAPYAEQSKEYRKYFGNQIAAENSFKRIKNDPYIATVFKKNAKEIYGDDAVSMIEDVKKYQDDLELLTNKEKADSYFKSLPEGVEYSNAENALSGLPKDIKKLAATETSETIAASKLKEQKAALAEAEEKLSPFKSWIKSGSEKKIAALFGVGKQGKLKELFGQLGGMSDQDFLTWINNAKTKADFNKDFTQGSAVQNAWQGLLGGSLGLGTAAATGQGLQMVGIMTAVGSALSLVASKYGTQVAKGLLDVYLVPQNILHVQKIKQKLAGMPPEVQKAVESGLYRSMGKAFIETDQVTVPEDSRAELSMMIRKDSRLDGFEKAQALTSLARDGSLKNPGKVLGFDTLYQGEKEDKRQNFDRNTLLKNIGG